ncbi:claudin-4-like [Brachyhypopomus gauderio]|uniref:claudin-4-like n=1 Tax=Brachyhypopomus gauderio TaxID=698409 RepID=UPI004042996B
MVALGLEILGFTLASLGWILAILSCALPMWRVTAFIVYSVVISSQCVIWEGIWMRCVWQTMEQMQCKVYDSMLALSSDLQAARALCVISILLGVLGVLVSVIGAKCTNCIKEEQTKAKVMITAGATFICAAVMQLIPVYWTAHAIITSFYNPLVPDLQKREIGASLYLGWAAAALLLIGGVILCCSCPPREEKRYGTAGRMVYSTTRFVPPSGYDRRDYV